MSSNSIQEMTAQAQALLDNNQLSDARDLYSEICKQDDANAEAWLMLGAVHGESGDVDEALSCVHKSIEINPTYAEAHLTLATILRSQGDLTAAMDAARAAIQSDSLYNEAYLMLSALQGMAGNLQDAEASSRRAADLSLNNAEAQVNLGNTLRMQGKLSEAEDCYRQAIKLDSRLASAHVGLGDVLTARQDYDEAQNSLQKAIELQPDLVEAYNSMGILRTATRDYDGAMADFDKVISLSPDFAPVYGNIANIHAHRGEFNQAISRYKKAIKLSPQLLEAYVGLGNTYRILGDREAARENYQVAIDLKPGYLLAHHLLGLTEADSGNYEIALRNFNEIISLDPDNASAEACRADIYEKMGDDETAYGIIRTLLDRGVRDATLGTVFARLCKTHDNCNDARRYLEELTASSDLAAAQRADAHFSLGELLDSQQEYDAAMTHFRQANELVAGSYDAEKYRQFIDQVIAANQGGTLSSIPAPSAPSTRPIFIVGMPRSGTTLVEQIISAHPQVHGGGELGAVFSITDKLQSITGSDKPYPGCIADLDQAAVDTLAGEYLAALDQLHTDAPRVTDKMPHNFQHLGLIHALFPDAPLLNVVRNPADTCLSCYFHNFGGRHPYTNSLDNLSKHYRNYARLMQYWVDEAGLPVLDVNYEELVKDPETVIRKIIDHCGLEWDDSCLNFHESGRIARTASYNQVRQPIYSKSVDRWKHYENHIQPLLEQLG